MTPPRFNRASIYRPILQEGHTMQSPKLSGCAFGLVFLVVALATFFVAGWVLG